MSQVGARELRNNTRSVLDRVEAGESVTITIDGRPVAELRPIDNRPRWASRARFVETILMHQADAALTNELRDLLPDMTDDIPPK
jgi:prevent-host-death family protein